MSCKAIENAPCDKIGGGFKYGEVCSPRIREREKKRKTNQEAGSGERNLIGFVTGKCEVCVTIASMGPFVFGHCATITSIGRGPLCRLVL